MRCTKNRLDLGSCGVVRQALDGRDGATHGLDLGSGLALGFGIVYAPEFHPDGVASHYALHYRGGVGAIGWAADEDPPATGTPDPLEFDGCFPCQRHLTMDLEGGAR